MRCAVTLAVTLVAAGAARGEGVLLLNGFEPDVIKAWYVRHPVKQSGYAGYVMYRDARDSGSEAVASGGGTGHPSVKGGATEGGYALVHTITAGKPRWALGLLKNPRTRESIRRRAGLLVNHAGAFRNYYPKDWSAYARLRIDVKSVGFPIPVRVEIMDSIISPPLRRVYQVPADKWVTVEFDLAEAARLREVPLAEKDSERLGVKALKGRLINLKDMANLRITVEQLKGPATIKLDNIRLVAAGAIKGETTLPVITDDRPFTVPAVLPPSEPSERGPASGKLNVAPVEWEEPVEIPGANYTFDVAVVDNDRMLMAVGTGTVLRTLDGGRTWTGLDGTINKPTKVIDHDTNAPGRTAAALGPDLMVLGVAKCSGGGIPIESYSILTKFDGTDWKLQPRGLVDVDNTHCPEWKVDLVRVPSGRVWTCWLHRTRLGRGLISARYSDDEGQTWRDAATNGSVTLTTRGKASRYAVTWWLEQPAMPAWASAQALGRIGPMSAHSKPTIAGWGDHVMCAYVWRDRITCAFFDGTKWSEPKRTTIRSHPADLTHFEGKSVYMAAMDGKVYRLEGEAWVDDTPPGGVGKGQLPYPGCSKTRLSAAGDVMVAAWTDGKTLFTSSKPKGGSWSKPREIATEERGVHWIGAPARSVSNFVPFVWSVKGAGARFIRIPVTQPE